MELADFSIFLVLAFFSEVLGTISGFGSSIIFVPVASLFYDIHTVLGITAIFHVFSNVFKLFLFKSKLDKEILIKLGLPALIFVLIGSILTRFINIKSLDTLLAIIVSLLALFILYYRNKTLKRTDGNLIWSGIGSGFLAGLIGTGGSLRGLALSAFNLEKEVFIFTSAAIDLGVDSTRSIVYIFNGFIDNEGLLVLPFLVLVSFVGNWFGKKIVDKLSNTNFKILVLITIFSASIIQIITTFWKF